MLTLFGRIDTMVRGFSGMLFLEILTSGLIWQTTELLEIKANITINRNQQQFVSVSTIANFERVKRDGRDGECA